MKLLFSILSLGAAFSLYSSYPNANAKLQKAVKFEDLSPYQQQDIFLLDNAIQDYLNDNGYDLTRTYRNITYALERPVLVEIPAPLTVEGKELSIIQKVARGLYAAVGTELQAPSPSAQRARLGQIKLLLDGHVNRHKTLIVDTNLPNDKRTDNPLARTSSQNSNMATKQAQALDVGAAKKEQQANLDLGHTGLAADDDNGRQDKLAGRHKGLTDPRSSTENLRKLYRLIQDYLAAAESEAAPIIEKIHLNINENLDIDVAVDFLEQNKLISTRKWVESKVKEAQQSLDANKDRMREQALEVQLGRLVAIWSLFIAHANKHVPSVKPERKVSSNDDIRSSKKDFISKKTGRRLIFVAGALGVGYIIYRKFLPTSEEDKK